MNLNSAHRTGNLMLDALPDEEREALLARMTRVDIPPKKLVMEIGEPVPTVYFPVNGMVSLVSRMEDGSSVETATYGREGIVGLPEALHPHATPSSQAIGQVDAESLALDAEAFREFLVKEGRLSSLVNAYLPALFNLIGQNASCNRLHQSTQRLARWLLLTSDRCGSDQFDLTHEFMGQMLGARRSTVSEGAEELQRAGLIRYVRGRITIVDRPRLVEAACECYALINDRFTELNENYQQLTSV